MSDLSLTTEMMLRQSQVISNPMAAYSDIVAAATRDIEMSRIYAEHAPISTSPVLGPMDVDGGFPKIEDGHIPLQSAGETSCVNRIHPKQPIKK